MSQIHLHLLKSYEHCLSFFWPRILYLHIAKGEHSHLSQNYSKCYCKSTGNLLLLKNIIWTNEKLQWKEKNEIKWSGRAEKNHIQSNYFSNILMRLLGECVVMCVLCNLWSVYVKIFFNFRFFSISVYNRIYLRGNNENREKTTPTTFWMQKTHILINLNGKCAIFLLVLFIYQRENKLNRRICGV